MDNKKQIERYNSLDKLRTLCAFLVVFDHTIWYSRYQKYIIGVIIICVPLFFMISGFFFHAPSLRKQMKKLLALLLKSSALFIVLLFLDACRQGNLSSFASSTFTVRNILMFLIFNQGMPRTHLWYLRAILYVIIVMYYADRYSKKDLLYKLIPVLLCCSLMLGKYSRLFFGTELEAPISRNWLFTGLPYYAIGMWIRENLETLRSKLQDKGKLKLILLIVFFAFTSIMERYLLSVAGFNTEADYTLSTALLSIAVFLFFLFCVDQKDDLFSYIGRADSTGIYIFHPIFVTILPLMLGEGEVPQFFTYIRAVIVFLITLIVVEIPKMLKRRSTGK